MSLTNEQYDTIMRIYSRRQADNRFRQKERQQAVYDAIPAFADLETEISSLQASRARLMLDDQAGQARCCADRLHTLCEQRNHLLAEHGFPADYLKPHYICPDCQDTGYIGRQKCHCFRQAEIDLLYHQSNLRQVLERDYQRLKGTETVRRTVEPVGILFSEYYFYLAAYLRGVDRKQSFENPEDPYPTIYRIDRIRAFCPTGEHFTPAYAKRFQEGEFRKRVQFMYGGKLQKIRFKYTGPSIESVLDRLPTAEILSQDDSGWLVSAEVFGKGIEMWIKSQGEYIETE